MLTFGDHEQLAGIGHRFLPTPSLAKETLYMFLLTSPNERAILTRHGGLPATSSSRKKVVVVGLGMVAVQFIEKLMKMDTQREYDVVVIGEEPHLAYNRVALTSYFKTRNIEELFMNPREWYDSMPTGALGYHLNSLVTEIDSEKKTVKTANGLEVPYDSLVLATGSVPILPPWKGHNAKGVFVYRTVEDLEKMIAFSASKKGLGLPGVCVGGGLLGLEAAKAMMDLEAYENVTVIETFKYLLARQVDSDGGAMIVEQVENLGVKVKLGKMVSEILEDEDHNVTGVKFNDGDEVPATCVCVAIGVRPRDDLAKQNGIECAPRGGILVGDNMQTNVPDVYAIGECANWGGMCYGLYAPGIEMADILAFNLTTGRKASLRSITTPDMSTKLKLLGVEVASFGDAFADMFGPKWLPDGLPTGEAGKVHVKALTYNDPFGKIYKKYLFTPDGKYLLGGMMIGSTGDYTKLLSVVKKQKQLETPPGELIVGSAGGEVDADDLDDDAQVCSCNNVSKGDIAGVVKEGKCKTIGEVKACTKAGTGCGSCVPLVTTIMNTTLAEMGQEVTNFLCPHFDYSRADLFSIIKVKELKSFEATMKECGKNPDSIGCELCKPTIGSILASLFNGHVIAPSRKGLQETNDKFLANIQRNGTYSVVPRVAGGEITPEKMAVISRVAQKYNLYCKITGGQRIDMFGARKQDLLDIWTELIDGGMESGHAYAKSLRTVKSCVGTTWCRFGVGDSVGMAIRIEERYKGIRAPHKLKGGVSGCVRECAEAQNKDFGLVATEAGYNIYVGGNGGAKPRHSEILAKDVPLHEVIPILDRYLAFYIRMADRLQRTARWIEGLPGGIKYLREVILDDRLGIAKDLEKQMEQLTSSYFCEWTEVVKNPTRRAQFQQFANTEENITDTIEPIKERSQLRPSYWPKESALVDFRGTEWTDMSWQPLVEASKFQDLPTGDSSAVKRGDTQLAVFKIRGKFYCTQQMCPHKRAFVLSDGLLGDADNKLWVSCPYHKRNYELGGDNAGKCSNDDSMNIATFPAEERGDGWVYVKLPPVDQLDMVLGTEKWKIKAEETEDPFAKMDDKLRGMKGRKGVQTNGAGRVVEHASNGIDW